MLIDDLKQMPKEKVFDFIRQRLTFKEAIEYQLRYSNIDNFHKEHRRFEMSGYDGGTGYSTIHNLSIVNEFADLGIYNYTSYFFLDFHKGIGTLYFKYWGDDERNQEIEFPGLGTIEIIYKIFEFTIFTNKFKRRRG